MKRFLLVATLSALACGCVLTISPLFSESEAVFNEQLLGGWRTADGDTAWFAQRGNDYVIDYKSSKQETGRFGGRLGRLADSDVLIIWPEPFKSELAEPYRTVMIPGYTVFGIELGDDQLTSTTINGDSLLAAVEAGDVVLTLSEEDNRLVVVDPTPALQTGFDSYLARPGSLADPEVWFRVE